MRRTIILLAILLLPSCGTKKTDQTFSDVPPTNPYYEYVERAVKSGVMQGKGSAFGVDDELRRWEAAVIIEKALGVVNPPFSGTVFNDVTDPSYGGYVEDFGKRGITKGCAAGFFCPDDITTNEQIAVFIVRALGELDPPAPQSQRFLDARPDSFSYNFIDRFVALGIGGSCNSPSLFCPSKSVTRGQMAMYIVKAFKL